MCSLPPASAARARELLFELGRRLHAFTIDLFGLLDEIDLRLSKLIKIPDGITRHQSWRALARAGDVDVSLAMSLVEGIDDHSVSLRGVSGAARLDFAADTLILDRPNASDIVVNPLRAELARASTCARARRTRRASSARSTASRPMRSASGG